MKKLLLSFLLVFSCVMIKAQVLTNNGTITIVGSGSLIVEGGMTNSPGSVLNMDASSSMTVSGNLIISSGSTINQDATITLNGNTASDLTSNGVTVGNVTINKTSGDVSILDDLNMAGDLGLTSGDFQLGVNDIFLGTASLVSGGSASSHVNTNSTGRLNKAFASATGFTFPVGDGTRYTPLTSNPTGTSGGVAVAVENSAPGGVVGPNFLSRNWKVNTTGFSSNALSGTYNEADDVNGSEALIKGAVWNGTNWTFNGSSGTPASDMIAATAPAGDVIFSGLNTIGTVKLRAFLAGPYNSGNGMMNTTLNDLGLLDAITTSPYGDGGTASIPNNDIVDWVLLELRNPSSAGDPVILKSAFINKNGYIVDYDGVSDPQIIGAYNPASVRLRHRNHLSVGTDVAIATQNPVLQDFTANMNVLVNGAGTPLKPFTPSIHALWSGDVNGDGKVRYTTLAVPFTPSDALSILTNALGGNVAGQLNGYSNFDVNMDGKVRYTTLAVPFTPSDALSLLTNTLNGNVAGQQNAH